MDSCFVHIHVPRTGGTTLREALFTKMVERLSPDQVFLVDLGSDLYRTGSFEDFKALSKREKQRLRFIAGHAPLEILEYVRRPFGFAILREPVDRTLSTYWYCFHNSLHPAHAKARTLTPVDFIAGGWGEARNGQARYLSGHAFHGGAPSDPELLEAASDALERISYVGFFDQLGPAVKQLCEIAGISPPAELPRINRAERMDISNEDLAAIRACNEVDVALYARALKR